MSYGGKRLSMMTWPLSDARVLNGGSLIELSTLYIERRVPPYDSSLGVFSLPPFSFSWSWKTGTNLFHGVGRFLYFTAHAFHNFGFGLSPSFKDLNVFWRKQKQNMSISSCRWPPQSSLLRLTHANPRQAAQYDENRTGSRAWAQIVQTPFPPYGGIIAPPRALRRIVRWIVFF